MKVKVLPLKKKKCSRDAWNRKKEALHRLLDRMIQDRCQQQQQQAAR